jgi:hypothetical protein
MISRLAPILLVAAASFEPASAGTVRGTGAQSCEVWTNNAQDPDKSALDQSWVLGYLSAASIYSAKDNLATTDNEVIFDWINDYCLSKADEHIIDAVEALNDELTNRTAK